MTEEWQPIDTAPKESERLILTEDGRVFYGFWCYRPFKEYRDMCGLYIDQDDEIACWMDCRDGTEVNPTHWHPHPMLPDPPAP